VPDYEPSHHPRSRPVFGPPLRRLASDPFHPVEGGSANDYDYADADPANRWDCSGYASRPDCDTQFIIDMKRCNRGKEICDQIAPAFKIFTGYDIPCYELQFACASAASARRAICKGELGARPLPNLGNRVPIGRSGPPPKKIDPKPPYKIRLVPIPLV
jgi:hypothetical protein